MADNNKSSIISVRTSGLVRVGNSIEVTNKILKEHEERNLATKIKTAKIGNQEWTVKNLDVDCYSNGDPIPQVEDANEWEKLKTGAWCNYENNSVYGMKFGKLYNWFAVNDPRGLVPNGYKVPSHGDWRELKEFLGGADVAGKELKSKTLWNDNANGNDNFGFNGLPGGRRGKQGSFEPLGFYVNWWSTRDGSPTNAIDAQLNYDNDHLYILPSDKRSGYYVRCLKYYK